MCSNLDDFLGQVACDIRELPLGSVQLVGALVAMQEGLPDWLRAYVMALLHERSDISEVSPAALSLMILRALAEYDGEVFAVQEMQLQQEFLQALSLSKMVGIAVQFMDDLADHLSDLLNALRSCHECVETAAL